MSQTLIVENPVLKSKLRTDCICQNCKFHTLQKKILVKKNEVWICVECGLIQKEIK